MHQSETIIIKLITIINKDECSWLILLYARVNEDMFSHSGTYSNIIISSFLCFHWFVICEVTVVVSLRKYAYSNILKMLPPKKWKFSDKNSDIFHISAQNIDCGYSLEPPRRGGSNEYPQSMFLSRNKKNNVYPCKPQFYYIKVGFKGVKII